MRISDWSSDVCSSDLVRVRISARRNLAVKRTRVAGQLALVVDQRARRQRLATLEGDQRLAFGDHGGREVEDDRLAAGDRDAGGNTRSAGALSQGTPSDGDLKPVPSALVVAQGLPAGRSRWKREGSRRRARSASDARTVEQR